jgi:hypothetical protein
VNAVGLVSSGSSGDTFEEYSPLDTNLPTMENAYCANSVWSGDDPNALFTGAVFPESSGVDVNSDKNMYHNDPDAVQLHKECMPSPSTPPHHEHLLWVCCIDGPTSSPVLHALIDHGCPTV